MTRRGLLAAALLVLPLESAAAACNLDSLIGYTIISKKIISSHIDDGKKVDGYEGCIFDRILVFSDNTAIKCFTFNYNYSFMPSAYLFSNGKLLKLCVEGEVLDVMPLR